MNKNIPTAHLQNNLKQVESDKMAIYLNVTKDSKSPTLATGMPSNATPILSLPRCSQDITHLWWRALPPP